jgi:hypothetical protein
VNKTIRHVDTVAIREDPQIRNIYQNLNMKYLYPMVGLVMGFQYGDVSHDVVCRFPQSLDNDPIDLFDFFDF